MFWDSDKIVVFAFIYWMSSGDFSSENTKMIGEIHADGHVIVKK